MVKGYQPEKSNKPEGRNPPKGETNVNNCVQQFVENNLKNVNLCIGDIDEDGFVAVDAEGLRKVLIILKMSGANIFDTTNFMKGGDVKMAEKKTPKRGATSDKKKGKGGKGCK